MRGRSPGTPFWGIPRFFHRKYRCMSLAKVRGPPIAWNLLRLRVLSRQEQPASKVLNHTQLKVLRASSKKELPAHLSVRDAMLAIAKLGGHLKRNGDPGWI